jgi:hypothetical protein
MRVKSAAAIAVVLCVVFLLGQCSRLVTSIRVRNDTEQYWYVSVARTPMYRDNFWLVLVDPGADAFAVEWEGRRDVAVQVLDAECNLAGTFHETPSGVYVVDAVPGLIGTMRDGPGYEPRTEIPGIHDTFECGGHLDR